MQIAEFMSVNNLDNQGLATLVGGIGEWGVHKWKHGQRLPKPAEIARIEEITNGAVTLKDWLELQSRKKAEKASRESLKEDTAA